MENNHQKYMQLAIEEAKIALSRGEVPIGAIVVSRGEIIGRGHNLVETLCDATAHAEMQAITAATSKIGGKYLNDCTLYVTVEPCPMCAGAIGWSQLGCLVYGSPDPRRGYRCFSEKILHPKTKVINGVLEEACGQIMSDFFTNLRK